MASANLGRPRPAHPGLLQLDGDHPPVRTLEDLGLVVLGTGRFEPAMRILASIEADHEAPAVFGDQAARRAQLRASVGERLGPRRERQLSAEGATMDRTDRVVFALASLGRSGG